MKLNSWQKVQYRLLWWSCRAVGLLPERVLYFCLGGLIRLILYRLVRYRRQVVRTNLAHSFPEKSEAERREIERKFYHHLSEVFVDTILEKAETDGQISNTTFILDGTLVYRDLLENFYFPDYINDWYWEANYGIVQCWFLDYYLLPYFYMRYAEIDEFMAKDNLGELLTEYGIKIICHTGGNNYYDLLNDIEISLYDRDFSDYIYNEQVFAIGTSWQDEYFVNEWLYSLRTYQETSYEFFPIYFYNENNFDLWISEDEYFRTASGTEYFMENIFPDIALAFASGDDLSVYDNWDGRCVVTHKPIYAGENGWLNMYMRVLPYCSEKRDWLEYFGH